MTVKSAESRLSAGRYFFAAAVAVLLLAAATRIINAGGWPVWTDEGASLYLSGDPRISEIFDRLTENHHPPLYFAALGRWRLIVGQERIALRLLTILSGVLATAVVYRLGADEFNKPAALYAALIFALADITIHYAQQIRHYGWLVLAVALTSLLFLRCLRKPSRSNLIAYALSIAFMLYTHYLGVVFLGLQGLFGLILWRASIQKKLRLIGAWALALILYTPWLIALQQILQLLSEGGLASRPNIEPTTLATLAGFIDLLADGQSALIVGVFGLAVWQIVRQRDRSTAWLARLYLVMMGGGLFIIMAAANIWLPMLTPRTLVFLMPGIALVAGYGFTLLPVIPRRVLIVALVILALSSTRVIQPRLASDFAAQTLAAMYSPGDLIVLETGSDDNAFEYELELALDDPNVEIIRTLRWVRTRGGVLPVIDEIDYELRQVQRVWVVQWFQPSQIMPALDAGEFGYRRALQRELSVGAEYLGLFDDQPITLALYSRIDGDEPRNFGDLLTLHSAILPESASPAEPLHIDLWWSAREALPLDYSVGVFLLDESGVTRAEQNAPPSDRPTTQWTPGDLMFDRHTLTIPPDLPPGTYPIVVNAYWYGDAIPLEVDGEPLAIVGTVTVE
jgi:hypothetical protein